MLLLQQLKKPFIIAAAALMCVPALGQDKLASIAPVDKKMRAIDSLSIMRMAHKEEVFGDPAESLYPNWNNEYTTNYGVQLPSEYKIDLRGYHMPTDSRLVTSHFGYRPQFRRKHYGTDIKVFIGDTIRAAFDGKVRIVDYEGKGYGKYVVIRHPNGLETLYGHMSKQLVRQDENVKAGDPIGLGGNTGRSYGSHLHFETRFLGQFIDPEKLFSFEAQDVLADYYMYHSYGGGDLLAAHAVGGESEEMTEEQATAMIAKEEESRAFQQEQIAKHKRDRSSSVHKVKSGENLSVIAKRNHTTVKKLCKLNHISETTTLRPGQILKCS